MHPTVMMIRRELVKICNNNIGMAGVKPNVVLKLGDPSLTAADTVSSPPSATTSAVITPKEIRSFYNKIKDRTIILAGAQHCTATMGESFPPSSSSLLLSPGACHLCIKSSITAYGEIEGICEECCQLLAISKHSLIFCVGCRGVIELSFLGSSQQFTLQRQPCRRYIVIPDLPLAATNDTDDDGLVLPTSLMDVDSPSPPPPPTAPPAKRRKLIAHDNSVLGQPRLDSVHYQKETTRTRPTGDHVTTTESYFFTYSPPIKTTTVAPVLCLPTTTTNSRRQHTTLLCPVGEIVPIKPGVGKKVPRRMAMKTLTPESVGNGNHKKGIKRGGGRRRKTQCPGSNYDDNTSSSTMPPATTTTATTPMVSRMGIPLDVLLAPALPLSSENEEEGCDNPDAFYYGLTSSSSSPIGSDYPDFGLRMLPPVSHAYDDDEGGSTGFTLSVSEPFIDVTMHL